MALQLQGSLNPEARGQAAVELGLGEGSNLRLAVRSRVGVHAGGHNGTLGLGSSSPGANSVGELLLGAVCTQCLVYPSLSSIKSRGDPAPAFTYSPAPHPMPQQS